MASASDLSQSIVERIQAALRLADHPNTSQEEAEAALMAAQRMAARYHVELDEFRLQVQTSQFGDAGEKVVHLDVVITKVWMQWKVDLVNTLVRNFRCKCYVRRGLFSDYRTKKITIIVVGHETDAQIVKATADYAITVGERVCRDYTLQHYYKVAKHTSSEGLKLRRSWLFGYVDGIQAKYKAQVSNAQSGTALMVVTPEAVLSEFGRLKFHGSSAHQGADQDNHAYKHGYDTGRNPHSHISA